MRSFIITDRTRISLPPMAFPPIAFLRRWSDAELPRLYSAAGRSTSATRLLHLPLHAANSLRQAHIGKVRERRAAGCRVEGAVAVVGHRPVARGAGDRDFVGCRRDHYLGNRPERVNRPGRDVQGSGGAPQQEADDELRHVVDQHMVATLLAPAE